MEPIITAAKNERVTRVKVSQKNTEPNNLKDKSKGQHGGGLALEDDRLCLPPSRRISTHRSKRETRTISHEVRFDERATDLSRCLREPIFG